MSIIFPKKHRLKCFFHPRVRRPFWLTLWPTSPPSPAFFFLTFPCFLWPLLLMNTVHAQEEHNELFSFFFQNTAISLNQTFLSLASSCVWADGRWWQLSTASLNITFVSYSKPCLQSHVYRYRWGREQRRIEDEWALLYLAIMSLNVKMLFSLQLEHCIGTS